MKTYVITHMFTQEIVVEKSRFIAYIMPIKDETEFLDFKKLVTKQNPGARHYPYAYQFGNINKTSDDGEPSGTAGRPLLELLQNFNMDEVALIVVRYFGGVKLGAGRLLRTYVEAGKQALLNVDKYLRITSTIYETKIKSAHLGQIEYLFNKLGIDIISRNYDDAEVYLTFNAPNEVSFNEVLIPMPTAIRSSIILRKEI